MPETGTPVKPLEPALKPLLLPEIIAKIALGAKIDHRDQEATVSFEGEAVRLSHEDLALSLKVSERVRRKLPNRVTPGSAILSVLLAQQFLAEELFRPGAVRVLFYSNISKASAFYRCVMPSYALGQGSRCMSHVTTGKFTRAALEYDVVVFQIDHSPGARQFARSVKEAGKRVVYELDDAFDCLEPWHPCYASFGTMERQASIKEMMHLADAVQTSTRWLADRYRKECARIEVVPNMIELSAWQTAPKLRKDGTFKIVWAGSSSHSGDLREIVPALCAFTRSHPDAKVVFFGQEMRDTGIPQEQVENIPWCELEEYTFKLAQIDADVSIAPLADIPFNHGKSNLRILQMWATGYPVVASDVGPYGETVDHGRDGLLCRSTEDWVQALEDLYEKPGIRKALASAGTESVKKWDVHPNIQKIEDFYASLVGER